MTTDEQEALSVRYAARIQLVRLRSNNLAVWYNNQLALIGTDTEVAAWIAAQPYTAPEQPKVTPTSTLPELDISDLL